MVSGSEFASSTTVGLLSLWDDWLRSGRERNITAVTTRTAAAPAKPASLPHVEMPALLWIAGSTHLPKHYRKVICYHVIPLTLARKWW